MSFAGSLFIWLGLLMLGDKILEAARLIAHALEKK